MGRPLYAIALSLVAVSASAQYTIETVAEVLEFPWSLAFLPDGSMLVTERVGNLRLIGDSWAVSEPVGGVPAVYVEGQSGLFDVILDPGFETNQIIYLAYGHGVRRRNATRVMRARFEGDSLSDQQVIFTATPWKRGMYHFGGRMATLQDGTLLITVGDGDRYREDAQRLTTHLGKVVRINTDGSAPEDNPWADSENALPEIYSYGHRNAQAILIVPDTGEVFLHEHGPRGGDELNRIEVGLNYGWPVITWGIDYPGSRISPFTEYEGMEQPLVDWTPSIAPAGMDYYTGDLFPEWHGDLFVAALAEQSIRRVDMGDGDVACEEILFDHLDVRFRDVRAGPDGALYLLVDSEDGEILRVTPAK